MLARFGSASSVSGDRTVSAFERFPFLMCEVAKDIEGCGILWVVVCGICAGWSRRRSR